MSAALFREGIYGFRVLRGSFRALTNFCSSHNIKNLYPDKDVNAPYQKPSLPTDKTGYIPIEDLKISYSNSSGPGGQHVNKTKSRVEVRFHVPSATWIPEAVKSKLMEREGNRITKENYFIISSERSRKQFLNQADCIERIRRVLRECEQLLNKPEPDPETVESVRVWKEKANQARLREKKQISLTKLSRRKPTIYDLSDS